MARLIELNSKDGPYFVIRNDWEESDFVQVAEDMEVSLTREQLKRAMTLAAKWHDANNGINWETIEESITVALGEEP